MMYGYYWEKIDVGHSWDLKGLTVQGDFTINHYHPIFNSVFKMLPSLNVMVVILMVGITLMLFFDFLQLSL